MITRGIPRDLSSSVGARPADETSSRDAFPARRELPKRAAIAGGFLLGSLTLSVLLSSCGGHKSVSAETQAQSTIPPIESVVLGSQGGVMAASAIQSSPSDSESVSETSLPPDLSATVMDTEVTPGESVQLYVEATPDVVEMTLWDGLHDKQSLTYDSEAKVWHGSYRVPLSSTGRIGLSVTARNDASRWRRVWVFLTVNRDEAKAALESEDDPGC
jgi:hypothetical protein